MRACVNSLQLSQWLALVEAVLYLLIFVNSRKFMDLLSNCLLFKKTSGSFWLRTTNIYLIKNYSDVFSVFLFMQMNCENWCFS